MAFTLETQKHSDTEKVPTGLGAQRKLRTTNISSDRILGTNELYRSSRFLNVMCLRSRHVRFAFSALLLRPRTLGQLDPHTIFRHRTLIAHPEFSVGQVDILLRNRYELSPCPHHLYQNNRFAAPVRILRPEQIAPQEMTLRLLLPTGGLFTISRCRPEIRYETEHAANH